MQQSMDAASPLLNVYRRSDLVMTHGEGCYLFDKEGKKYLDFASGIAVNSLGHSHPSLVKALQAQAEKLWHCSNLFHTDILDRYAAALVQISSWADKVFFCSSGSEAVESMLKTIRRYQHLKTTPPSRGSRNGEVVSVGGKTKILVAEGAFHGRSLGALSACFHTPSREGFEPLLPGFEPLPFNNIAALEKAATDDVGGILLETIQGEGGIRAHSDDYLQAARRICDERGIILALDEVQCGFGRTGNLFAFEKSGIAPDIVTLAKGIGGGFPLAAMLTTDKIAEAMTPGSHGSTYGSNPLAMAVGEAVLKEITKPGFLSRVKRMGELLKNELQKLCTEFPTLFSEARGEGLLLGITLTKPETKYDFSAALRKNGLLVAPAVTGVLRILPPLIIEESHINEAAAIIRQVSKG